MSTLEYILVAILLVIYITCLFTVCVVTFKNGHWILGILGIFFPIFWLIGVTLPPTKEGGVAALLEE